MTSGWSKVGFALRVCLAILCSGLMLTACGSSGVGDTSATTASAADGAGWTLLVRADGPRWLGPAWWRAQGLDPETLDRTTVTLSQGGGPVSALWQEAPDGWGMLFYGEVTDTAAGPAGGYALTIGEPTQVAVLQETGPDTLSPCQTTTEAQVSYGPDEVFRSTAPMDSPWLWQSLRPVDAVTVTLPFTNAVLAEPLQLTVRAWGQSAMPQDPDHHLRILWNGEAVEDHFWDGSALETWSIELPASGLETASIGIVAPGETEAPVELTWLDELSVSWQQSLAVSPDAWQQWRAEPQPGACFSIADGVDAGVYVAVVKRSAGDVSYVRPGVDSETGQVIVAQAAGDVGWVGVPWTAPAPDVIRARQTLDPAELQQLDYLVISPSALWEGIAPLVSARQEAGLSAGVVAPEAIYDTYGIGVPEAVAIQQLVNDLHTEGRLRYLLLVGDASADPAAVWDPAALVLPTIWVRTSYVGATASDYALATGGTGAPIVAVGRFPVTTMKELKTVVQKTLAWDPSDRLLLVSDDEPAFSSLTKQLGDISPPDQVVDSGLDGARDEVLRWLGEGPGTLVYTGHGSMGLLGDEKLLLLEDGANWRQPTVVAAWSCLCASFAHPDYTSLAEAWLLAPTGVVAVIGPTGETTTAEQAAMALAVQRSLAAGEPVGQALLRAWLASQSDNTKNGFLLLGDPALQPMPEPQSGGVSGE